MSYMRKALRIKNEILLEYTKDTINIALIEELIFTSLKQNIARIYEIILNTKKEILHPTGFVIGNQLYTGNTFRQIIINMPKQVKEYFTDKSYYEGYHENEYMNHIEFDIIGNESGLVSSKYYL